MISAAARSMLVTIARARADAIISQAYKLIEDLERHARSTGSGPAAGAILSCLAAIDQIPSLSVPFGTLADSITAVLRQPQSNNTFIAYQHSLKLLSLDRRLFILLLLPDVLCHVERLCNKLRKGENNCHIRPGTYRLGWSPNRHR